MTTHRYHTPVKGTTDWHIPLNENFAKLDTDVEIRDVASNIDTYDPVDGAKFLATDSNEIFLGTGSDWTRLGVLPQSDSSGTGGGDGSLVAAPEDVQTALDQVESNGGGCVRLDSTQRYEQSSSPWVVGREVVLDFNGAILRGSGSHNDTDVIHIKPSGQVHNPKIDLYDGGNAYHNTNKYSARVFTLDAGRYGPYFADGTTIRGGWTGAVECDGTWIYMTPGSEHVAFVTVESNITRAPGSPGGVHSLATGIHVDSGSTKTRDGGGWNNSVQCYGNWRDCLTTVKQTGEGMNFGHWFHALVQPPSHFSDPLPNAVWQIDSGDCHLNIFGGIVWDVFDNRFPNRDAWQIDGFATENSWQQLHPTTGSAQDLSTFTDNNAGTNYVVNPKNYQSTTV